MTTYEPHWEMHGFTGKQHLIVRAHGAWWTAACGLSYDQNRFVNGNDERGQNRCRSCDRSAT